MRWTSWRSCWSSLGASSEPRGPSGGYLGPSGGHLGCPGGVLGPPPGAHWAVVGRLGGHRGSLRSDSGLAGWILGGSSRGGRRDRPRPPFWNCLPWPEQSRIRQARHP
eukprot:8204445-Pyramimonas_sp.AAC.1